MNLYHDTELPIREELKNTHALALASFSEAGRWWSGRQRAAIVAEARDARCDAGLQDQAVPGPEPFELPDAAKRIARQVAVSTNDLGRDFFEKALDDGLSDTQYVETVGIVSRLTNLDVFARGIGVPPRKLAEPSSAEPSCTRPETARNEGAWTDSIPGGRRGKQEAIDTYGSNAVEGAPFIYRALSLVPEEAEGLIALGAAQYLDIGDFMDLNFSYEPNISRAQIELLAARVSAINECFY
jgi:hypothetical protein